MSTLLTKLAATKRKKWDFDLCSCGQEKTKVSKTCQDCYSVRQIKNPKKADGSYTHKKGNCILCKKQISDVYRSHCRSCSHLGKKRPNVQGAKHPRYAGGKTPENTKIRKSFEGKMWVQAVLLRDNFICKKCETRGGKLEAHHVYNFASYPELRLDINNGITFCKKDHLLFHKNYGYTNNNFGQVQSFINKQNI